MKRIYLFVLSALMMLMSTSAMAQSETVKGDVNGDGVVDVADIAAVIKIMTENGDIEKKYYWYVGTVNPSNMTPPSVGDANATLCEWTLISSKPTEIAVYKTDENWDEHTWYIAIPEEYGYSIYDNGNNNITNITFTKTTSTIANVKYAIYTTTFKMDTIDVKVKQ